MTNPPSHIRVSVEETENGYIVQAGSAVARISRTILGYAVDADSQVLKEEYNLSPGVEKVRKSAHTAVQFSADPTDETRLILRTQRNFLLLSQAVEMVCGFPPKDFPRESDWKLLSAWKNERDVVVEPEHAVASQIGETTTPAGVSSGEVQGEFGTTLQDIVSEVEDAVDAEYQSYSWRVIPNKSAEKFLDKSAFEFHETGVPKDVCDFFGATNLPAGSRKPINLINNSKRLTGYIIKDMTKSGRVKLRWDDDVSDIISRYRKKDGDKLSLVFLKMLDLDTYNIIVRKVVGAKTGENNTIPSVVEEPVRAVASKLGENITPVGVSSGEVQGEFGTTVQDIVSEVEDAVDADYSLPNGLLNIGEWTFTPDYQNVSFTIQEINLEKGLITIPDNLLPFFGIDRSQESIEKNLLIIYDNRYSDVRDYFNAQVIVGENNVRGNGVFVFPKSLIYQIFIDIDEKYSEYIFSLSKESDNIICINLKLITDINENTLTCYESKNIGICNNSSELSGLLESLGIPRDVSKAVSICTMLGTTTIGEARKELSLPQGDKGRVPFELAENFGYVRSYIKKNSRGKVTTYYTLSKSTDEIYEDIKKNNFKLISNFHSIYDDIDFENDTYDKLIKNIIALGVSELKAKVLLILYKEEVVKDSELFSRFSLDDIQYKRLIRELFSNNWLCTEKSRDRYSFDAAYSLRQPLVELLYNHIINRCNQVNDNLNILKHTLLSLPDREIDLTESECSPYNDSEIVEHIISALGSSLVEHTVVSEHILDVCLSIPLLKKVRIYHFPLIQSSTGYMIVLKQLGKSHLDMGLDFADSSFLVICGYEPELELFAFWDAYSPFFSSIKNKRQLTLNTTDLYSGLSYGIKKINNQKTKAILVSDSYNLSQALDVLYDHYLST